MPIQLPGYNVPDAENRAGVQYRATQVPDVYGQANIRAANPNIGQANIDAAQAHIKHGLDYLDEQAQKDALAGALGRENDFQTKIQDYLYNPETGVMNLKGEDAKNVTQKVRDYMTGLRNDAMAGVTDPVARRALGNSLNSYANSTSDAVIKHEFEQHRSALNSNFDETVSNKMQAGDIEGAASAASEKVRYNNGSQADMNYAASAVRAQGAESVIHSSIENGNLPAANHARQVYGPYLPGHQQIAIDNKLHAANMQQTGKLGVAAAMQGLPIPEAVGAPPAKVQAVVADAAHQSGVDPNVALTVARIESNYGQNVGKRGDIGQTGKGGDLPTQAQNMVQELAKSQQVAQQAVGRQPEAWESYLCYQQGAAGGPALLKAGTAKAVDVLKQFYKNPTDAAAAIVANGGNLSMSANDFCQFIQKKYNDNAARASITVPAGQAPGQSILAAHQGEGEAVQPSSSPRQALLNYDAKIPGMMARIQAVPNNQVRETLIKEMNAYRTNLAVSASAYSQVLDNKAAQIASDPGFVSMTQVPPELQAELFTDHPEKLQVMEARAQENANKAGASKKSFMDQQLDKDPVQTSQDLNAGKYNFLLNPVELADYKQKAVDESLKQQGQRQNDVAAYAMKKGLIQPENLAITSPPDLAKQIAMRLPVIESLHQQFGSEQNPLTKDEASTVSNYLSTVPAPARLVYMKSLRDTLPGDSTYREVIDQIRPNSPVTSWAGAFLDTDKEWTEKGGWFSQDATVQPYMVAQRLMIGEDLINPPKVDGRQDKAMPMPSDEGDNGMRALFADYGKTFQFAPRQADEAYKATKAYYAALSSEAGDYSGKMNDESRFTQAMHDVLGNKADVNGNGDVRLPWGMNEDTFMNAATVAFNLARAQHGVDPKNWDFRHMGLMNTAAQGVYNVTNGNQPLHDPRTGELIYIDVLAYPDAGAK